MFTKESFKVISCTDIPRVSLLKGVLKQLEGREIMIDTDEDTQEKLYNGDVFREIACELAEMGKSSTDDSKVFTKNLLPSQAIIDQIYNLSELIQTKLVRVVAI